MTETFPTEYPLGQTWLFDIGVAQISHELRTDGQLHYCILTGAGRCDA